MCLFELETYVLTTFKFIMRVQLNKILSTNCKITYYVLYFNNIPQGNLVTTKHFYYVFV